MALPPGVTHVTNIKGDKGDTGLTGTFASASAETVPADESASVVLSGSPEARHAHFRNPRGLPGVNAIAADDAVATYLGATDTATRAKFDQLLDAWQATINTSRLFGGVSLHTYGNSWVEFGSYDMPQPFPAFLPGLLGFASRVNRGLSGRRMQDNAITTVRAGHANTWPVGTRAVVLINDLLNNLIEADTPANRAAAVEGLRAQVAVMSASARIEQNSSAFAYQPSPTWNSYNSTQAYASGGSVATAAQDGCAVDVTMPSDSSYLLFHGTDGALYTGFRVRMTLDGRELAVKDLNGVTVRTGTGREGDIGIIPVAVRMDAPAGSKVRVTVESAGRAGFAVLDAVLPQSKQPPLIVVVKPLQTTAATHAKPDLLTYLRTVPDVIAAEFGSHVVVVDPAPGWNPSTMLGADGLHPNALGGRHVADAVADTLKQQFLARVAGNAWGARVA